MLYIFELLFLAALSIVLVSIPIAQAYLPEGLLLPIQDAFWPEYTRYKYVSKITVHLHSKIKRHDKYNTYYEKNSLGLCSKMEKKCQKTPYFGLRTVRNYLFMRSVVGTVSEEKLPSSSLFNSILTEEEGLAQLCDWKLPWGDGRQLYDGYWEVR